MERRLWEALVSLVARCCPPVAKVVYSDRWIVLVYFWGVIHDRPQCWSVNAINWPAGLGPVCLPSAATLSRRLRRPRLQPILQRIAVELGGTPRDSLLKILDAKPLAVGSMSKDRDARWGQAGKAKAKGYKLFALWGSSSMPLAWSVGPMNVDEGAEAKRLLPHLTGGGYVLGDAAYDENALYDLAWRHGHQLVAPRKKPGAGLGHRPHSPQRLRSIDLLEGREFEGVRTGRLAFATQLYAYRTEIERRFSQLTSYGGGLGPLPTWVRRMHRVTLWVHAKILLRALRETVTPQQLAA